MRTVDNISTNQASTLPYPYSFGPAGIYRAVVSKDGEEDEKWLCSELVVLGTGCDEGGQNWGRVLEVVDPNGKNHQLFFSMAELSGSAGPVLKRLSGSGLLLARGKATSDGILDLLGKWEGTARYLTTQRKGWASTACDTFVLDESRILGTQKVFLMNQTEFSDRGSAAKGDIEFWKKSVAQRCIGNPILLASLSLAFCGPLLDVAEIDSFGLHLRGSSSCGKSTALNAAVSIWGGPKRLSSWRTTANALESIAANMNSTLLALDELGQVSGKDAFDAAYTLGNGQGKRRANASGNATPSRSWRVPVLSSGEISLAEKISETGQKIMTGQEVRIIDVAADIGKFGIFDNIHGAASAALFAEALKEGARSGYGLAGPMFVENCLRNRNQLREVVQRNVANQAQSYLKRLTEPADGPAQRVASSFALIAIAGELATVWGITGWQKGTAKQAAAQLFEAWHDRHLAVADSAKMVWLPKLDSFLEREIGRGILAANHKALQNEFGFCHDTFIYLNEHAWSVAFGPANITEAARALAVHGVLVRDGNHFKTKTPRTLGDRERFYRLRTSLLRPNAKSLIEALEASNSVQAA